MSLIVLLTIFVLSSLSITFFFFVPENSKIAVRGVASTIFLTGVITFCLIGAEVIKDHWPYPLVIGCFFLICVGLVLILFSESPRISKDWQKTFKSNRVGEEQEIEFKQAVYLFRNRELTEKEAERGINWPEVENWLKRQ